MNQPAVRVLHVHTLPLVSGSGLNTWLSMRGQRDVGWSVELACAPGGGLVDLVEQAGMRVRAIRHFRQPIHPGHDVLALLELWRLCRRERYTIVHTHNSKAGILGRLAARLAGVPIVVHTHHSCVFQYPHLTRLQQGVFLWIERLAAQLTDHCIMISEPLRATFAAARVVRPERMTTIYSGIELAPLRDPADVMVYRREFRLTPATLVLGTVARLDCGKGHEELFQALAGLLPTMSQPLTLLVVGDGPWSTALQRRVDALHLTQHVVFTGARQDVAQLTRLFDVAVLASHFEGMGRVLLEAQAAGKPVVATRVGGIPDIVRDGETGLLVPPGDVAALTAALRWLVTDPALRHQMGVHARQWVSDRFSSDTMARQIVTLYQQLLARSRRCSTP